MTSNDINWDTLIYDDISSQSYDLIHDKSKDKLLDFDYNLLGIALPPAANHMKYIHFRM